MSSWRCLDCPDHGSGTDQAVQSAAQKHTKTTDHGTSTSWRGEKPTGEEA